MNLVLKADSVTEKLNTIKNQIFDDELDALEVYAASKPLMDEVKKFNDAIKGHVMDKIDLYAKGETAFGYEVGIKNGGETLNFKDDPVYAKMHKALKDREDLLKTALKSNDVIFDSEGIEVPKVSTKQKANSIILTKPKAK